MRLLTQQGIVTRRRGIGTMVNTADQGRYIQATTAVIDLPRYVEDTRLVKTAVTELLADRKLAQLLGCPQGQKWVKVDAYRLAGESEQPMALTRIYISAAYGNMHQLIGAMKIPVYLMLEQEFGIKITEIQQEITAVLIDAVEANALAVPPKSAGLAIIRRYMEASGRTVEVATNLHPASRFSYSTLMRLSPPASLDR